jgi:aminoglycoside phosphotransferase (APT) family kinase protein
MMEPRGINQPNVTAWFEANVPDVKAPLEFTLIAGGRSNLTFKVTDAADHEWALRRPPVSHVLPTAHDMSREYRIITALGPTEVPVPITVGLCTDPEVNERPFYVMEFVNGHILRGAAAVTNAFDQVTVRSIGDSIADTLAVLHAVDVEAVGLSDLARHEGYIERQVRRWSKQFHDMLVGGDDYEGLVEQVGAELAATIPEQHGVSIVHGDYRLDNTVIGDDGKVRAILDWELCTLGDAMADVGVLMCYWNDGSDPNAIPGVSATSSSGMATKAEVLSRYAESSGRDVSDVGFYTAFGYWKLACILQGVYCRYLNGAGAGDSAPVDQYPAQIRRLAQTAATSLAAR